MLAANKHCMKFDFGKRLARLQKFVEKRNCAAVLTAAEGFDANAYYYSGDETFPTTLVVTPDYAGIYTMHPSDFGSLFDEAMGLPELRKGLGKKLKELKVKAIGVDDNSASAGVFLRAQKRLGVKLLPIGNELAQERLIKEPAEIKCIREAGRISVAAVKGFGSGYFSGKTENAVTGEMELRARKMGAALDAFPTMVLSGARSAFFHNHTSNKRIGRSEAVLIDWGGRFEHYCSDHSRTYYDGRDKQLKDAIEATVESKKAAEKLAKVDADGKKIADAAEKVIGEYGFGEWSFRKTGLALGHFVGLDVHDAGVGFERTKLRRGMAFTIEPGVYIPGKFGVRFEDTYCL